MWLFSLYLFIVLLIWIICLQTQVSQLSATIKLLNKKVSELIYSRQTVINDQNKLQESKPAPVITPETKPQTEKPLSEQHSDNIPVQPQPQINSSAYTPVQNTYRTIQKQNSGSGFQNAFLGNIFNKIGAVAIIIALIIFIKLVSPFIVLTPVMKVVLGYLIGIILSSGALIIHKKENMKNYSEVLLGTGFAVLYITTYCSCSLLKVFSAGTTVTVGLFIMLLAYLIANKMKTVSMLVIGLIGAYLTPLITNVSAEMLYTDLIFINLFSVIFALRNQKAKSINIVNLVLTLLIFSVTYIIKGNINIVFPLLLWGIYLIYDLLRDKLSVTDNVTCWLNYIVLTIFSIWIFKDAHTQLGWLVLSTAAAYIILSVISRKSKNELYKSYDYSILINLWLYVYFSFSDIYSVMSWAVIALVISFFAAKKDTAYLSNAVVGYYMTTFAGTLLAEVNGQNCFSSIYDPIWNFRTLIFAVSVFSMLFAAKIFKNFNEKYYHVLLFSGLSLAYLYVIGEINSVIPGEFSKALLYIILGIMYTLQCKRISVTRKSVLFEVISYITGGISLISLICWSYAYPAEYIVIFNLRFAAYLLAICTCLLSAKWTKQDAYKYIAVVLGFLLCHTEAAGIVKISGSMEYLISLSWVLYSGIITISGILKNKRFLMNTGIVLSILTTLRIFIYDLANVDMIYKLIAFFTLGIILMLISYIYTKTKQ